MSKVTNLSEYNMEDKQTIFRKKVGVNIRKYRKDIRMRQWQLADLVGSTKNQISHYETGYLSIPIYRLYLIANIFNVPITHFFEECDKL